MVIITHHIERANKRPAIIATGNVIKNPAIDQLI